MATFDSKGFSAVAAFFGDDGSAKSAKQDLSSTSTVKKNRVGKRAGVGAGPSSKEDQGFLGKTNDDMKHRLQGSSRRRKNDTEEDIEDYSTGEESDEDEEGRTSIAKESSKKREMESPIKLAQPPSKKKKGKKLGKKERNSTKEKLENTSEGVICQSTSSENKGGNESLTKESANAETQNAQDPSFEKSEGVGEVTKKNRKRRKIRSRQKNIRKDNRTNSEKPKELNPFLNNYAGLPMTPTTRKILNLPKKSKSIAPIARNSDNIGVELAIDDWLDDKVGTDEGSAEAVKIESKNAGSILKKEKKRMKKKNKKRKYRNLG